MPHPLLEYKRVIRMALSRFKSKVVKKSQTKVKLTKTLTITYIKRTYVVFYRETFSIVFRITL